MSTSLTPAVLDYLASEMSVEFPHLSISVERRGDVLYVRALPQIEASHGPPAAT